MPFKILIIDDDIDDKLYTISQLKSLLEKQGYDVKATADHEDAYDLVFAFHPDVIVLDIRFGSQDEEGWGFKICKSIRDNGCRVPIILITKYYTQTEDVVKGLELGADDYVRLPCDMLEIRARILANLPPATEEYDDYLRVDFEGQLVCVKRNEEWQEVVLRPLQFKLLRKLVLRVGQVVEYYKLALEVWDKEEVDERSIYKCLCELRTLVEPDRHDPVYFETVRGVGLRFNGRLTSAYRGSAKRRSPC